MMRTIEVLLVITIITAAFIISAFFAVLPSPRQVSPINLRRLALTTLQLMDVDHDLSDTAFKPSNDPAWGQLQISLAASLPPNVVYNLTIYDVQGSANIYTLVKSISNGESLGVGSDSATYLVASSNVTYNVTPQKIGESQGGLTLYILNCSDANGWWITGYTAQSLAQDLKQLLSPYFGTTVMVQNTTQLGQILNGTVLQGENLQNAVIINTFGEAVPIPSGYYSSPGVGYDAGNNSYSKYCYALGQRIRQYNWTWVSIVGYPLYYVCNTGLFPNDQNTWGIYGMQLVGPAGLNAFLQGIDNQSYWYNSNWITGSPGVVNLSSQASYYCNYYGVYPSAYQTATRALPDSILATYELTVTCYVFDKVNNWIAGAVYNNRASGSLLALGLTRTPDVRLTGLGLLCAYQPRLYNSQYTANSTSRLVVLQLGELGGI
jgi:hypothetical protein